MKVCLGDLLLGGSLTNLDPIRKPPPGHLVEFFAQVFAPLVNRRRQLAQDRQGRPRTLDSPDHVRRPRRGAIPKGERVKGDAEIPRPFLRPLKHDPVSHDPGPVPRAPIRLDDLDRGDLPKEVPREPVSAPCAAVDNKARPNVAKPSTAPRAGKVATARDEQDATVGYQNNLP